VLHLVRAVGLDSGAVYSVIHAVVAHSWLVHQLVHSLLVVNLESVHSCVDAVLSVSVHLLVHIIHAVALVESVHLVIHTEHVIPVVLHAVVGWVMGHDRVGESGVSLGLTLDQCVEMDWVRFSSVQAKLITLRHDRLVAIAQGLLVNKRPNRVEGVIRC